MSLGINKEGKMYAFLNGILIWQKHLKAEDNLPSNGFVALGTKTFGFAQFDDFVVVTS